MVPVAITIDAGSVGPVGTTLTMGGGFSYGAATVPARWVLLGHRPPR